MKRLSLLVVFALIATTFARIHIPLYRKAARLVNPSETQKAAMASGYPVHLGGGVAQYGEYFAQLWLGTPGQMFEVQVDTGSSDLLVNSVGCDGCGDTRDYDADKSSTDKKISCNDSQFQCRTCYQSLCGFDDEYGDGSEVSGYVVSDRISFGAGIPNATVTFGATEKSTPGFEPSGVDGIWGLGYQALSSWSGVPPFLRWAQQSGISPVYSMCLGPDGGSLILGGDYSSGFQWTPVTKKLWFVVQMNDFKIAGKSVGLRSSDYADAIVDSGTTLMLIPQAAYNKVVSTIKGLCSSTNLPGVCGVDPGKSIFDGYCYIMTSQQIASFPKMSVTIQGVSELPVYPQDYLIAQQNYFCFGIQPTPPGMGTILGDVFMGRYHVAFDMQQNRVGFAALSDVPCN